MVAFSPSRRGLGYCVFDTPRTPVDWGCGDYREDKMAQTLKKVGSLLKLYQPKIIVLENPDDTANRADHIKDLITAITEVALKEDVAVRHYSSEEVRQVFPVANKGKRARDIVKVLPELRADLPPKRQAWNPQHPRMQVFDAVSLILTYFYLET